MEIEIEGSVLPKGFDLVIPPLRNTAALELPPGEIVATEIARKQLENLNKLERKPKKKLTLSDTDVSAEQSSSATEIVQKGYSNMCSPIVSRAELEDEIRLKVAKHEPNVKKVIGTIEIPQEIIMSGLNTTPITKSSTEETVQMHDQELIDILEGKSEETGLYEIVQDSHGNVIVTDTTSQADRNSYEIVNEAKAKLLEREIAMRQIASLPMRKNKKVNQSTTPEAAAAAAQTIVQSLAAEWTDDDKDEEMILEVVNVSNDTAEPKIKILNMTILNEAPDSKPKITRISEGPSEPKILNKNAPKILNINASAAEPATFKRSRVVKKKEIWDPSSDKKTAENMLPLALPPSITIKKVTKETITKASAAAAERTSLAPVVKVPVKKGKKLSEIDKLLQDEGAVNMIYSLERENNNRDVPEIDIRPDTKLLIDKSQEKSSLVSKAKAIKNVVLKQSTSPPEVKASGRARAKRDITPTTSAVEPKAVAPKASAARKKKADNTWDYIYSQAQATCDDAMIIRRRSNSSYSSSAASPRRMSVDVNESLESPAPIAKKTKQGSKDGFEFTKPPQKIAKSPADNVLNKDFVEQLRGKISNVITKNKEKPTPVAPKGKKRVASAAVSDATPAKRSSERRSNGSDSKEYKLEKIQTPSGAVTHIIINQTPLSISLLSEMKSLLNQIETDGSVAVLITSSEGFSEGLDYSTLVQSTVDKRKQAASDLVTAFKNFLISLAAFPKPLVCGVDGSVAGISVAMLPLFDLVLAGPSATFSLPHGKIGANPEGISILKHSGKVNVNAVNQMFYLSETLSAEAAQTNGLITKIIADNFDKELINCCKLVAGISSQAVESTKNLLNEDFLGSLESHLAKEVKILQQQWITAECQDKFKKHVAKGSW